jgi:hypothetical protein
MKTINCGFRGITARNDLTGYGPTLYVNIGFDKSWSAGKIPIAGKHNVPALIDTGAIECFIDSSLASELELPISDRRELYGGLGKNQVYVYLAQVFVPTLGFTQHGQFAGVHLAGGFHARVLMGRTFLEKFKMLYDGPSGRVTLTG